MRPPAVRLMPGPRHLGRLELAGDQVAATIVPQCRGEMQGRDAERGPELDDRPRAAASRQHVEQRAGLSRDRQRNILQAPVEVDVLGLAPHQARPLFVGEIGHCGVGLRQGRIGLFEQAVQQGRKWGGGQGGHAGLRSE